MVQTCSKCSRANPEDAVYCYYDGFVLAGHGRSGGPIAVGSQPFSSPFVFPSGRTCQNFDQLAIACQEEWSTAKDLLKQGYLERFLGGLGRVDLAMAAKEAEQFPDGDIALDQLIAKLPTEAVSPPRLQLETEEVNLGIVPVGEDRTFDIKIENQGMRYLYGTISCADGVWLSLGDKPGVPEKHFQLSGEQVITVKVVGEKLRAGKKPLQARLDISSNGGNSGILVRAEVPVKPFASGVLAGAKTPRQVAEKARANPKEAAPLFEQGEVADWYKVNGWTYPVQGPPASGLGAVQQFFEALGLTPAPKVQISEQQISLRGDPGGVLTHTIKVETPEKRPVYAHGVSNESWLQVERAKLNGRVATITVNVSPVPDTPGETLNAKLTVQANGNQRFVLPVTLEVSGERRAGSPVPVEVIPADEPALADNGGFSPASPPAPVLTGDGLLDDGVVVPSLKSAGLTARKPAAANGGGRQQEGDRPSWVHLVPAGLLLLAVLGVVVADLAGYSPGGGGYKGEPPGPIVQGSWDYDRSALRSPDPRLQIQFNSEKRFGIQMTEQVDPNNKELKKRLTYHPLGGSNNTIVKINGFEYHFGKKVPAAEMVVRQEPLPNKRLGWVTRVFYREFQVMVTQHVEIVPGHTGFLDTCLIYYTMENQSTVTHTVGLRVMIDTYIGANDGVPFTIPGQKGFLTTQKELKGAEIPDYIEVIEKPNDVKDPGTVARMGLKGIQLPGIELEPVSEMRITRFPGSETRWEVPLEPMKEDSSVALYWEYRPMQVGAVRHMAFTYGLSSVDISGDAASALALSAPASVQPGSEFIVTAYVWGARQNQKVTLKLPEGLSLADGESDTKTISEAGPRQQVSWKVRATEEGTFQIEATSNKTTTKPYVITVKKAGIFG